MTATAPHPADLLPTYLFERITYDQARPGDRVRVPYVYAGQLIHWFHRIVTVDRVEWIDTTDPGEQALMLRLAEPILPDGDRFLLITGRDRIGHGLQRVVGVEPPIASLEDTVTPVGPSWDRICDQLHLTTWNGCRYVLVKRPGRADWRGNPGRVVWFLHRYTDRDMVDPDSVTGSLGRRLREAKRLAWLELEGWSRAYTVPDRGELWRGPGGVLRPLAELLAGAHRTRGGARR